MLFFERQPTTSLKRCLGQPTSCEFRFCPMSVQIDIYYLNATVLPWNCGQDHIPPCKSSALCLVSDSLERRRFRFPRAKNLKGNCQRTGASKRVASVADTKCEGADSTSKTSEMMEAEKIKPGSSQKRILISSETDLPKKWLKLKRTDKNAT